jgi:hypothetical protein
MRRRAYGKNQCHIYFLLTLSLTPYALSLEIEERSLVRLRREGNAA